MSAAVHFKHMFQVTCNTSGEDQKLTFLISAELQRIYVVKGLCIYNFLILHGKWLFLFQYFWLPSGQEQRAAQCHSKASKEGYDAYQLFLNSHNIQVGLPLSRMGAVHICSRNSKIALELKLTPVMPQTPQNVSDTKDKKTALLCELL